MKRLAITLGVVVGVLLLPVLGWVAWERVSAAICFETGKAPTQESLTRAAFMRFFPEVPRDEIRIDVHEVYNEAWGGGHYFTVSSFKTSDFFLRELDPLYRRFYFGEVSSRELGDPLVLMDACGNDRRDDAW